MNVVKICCPSCMTSLAEDDLHTNVLYCPYCGSYNYFDKGLYNNNVLFCLVGSKPSDFDGLKEVIIGKLTDKGVSVKQDKIQHIRIERFMLPVREVVVDNEHVYVSMLETDAEEIEENNDIRELLANNLQNFEKLFAMNKIHPLRLDLLKDVTDRKGHVYKTHILPASRSKYSVDEIYKINPLETLRILYIPIYRLSFANKGISYVCMGDDNLTGLPIDDLVTKEGGWISCFDEDEEMWKLALVISFLFALLVTILVLVYVVKDCNENPDCSMFFTIIIHVLLALTIPTVGFVVPVHVFLNSFVNTIHAVVGWRKRILRKLLAGRFCYNS